MNAFTDRAVTWFVVWSAVMGTAGAQEPTDVRFDPEKLPAIQDDVGPGGIGESDRPVLFEVLDHAQQVPLDQQRAAAKSFVEKRRSEFEEPQQFELYLDLLRSPERYRGRPLTFQGQAQELKAAPAPENDNGIGTLYEGWLVPPGSNAVRIVTSSIPDGFPLDQPVIDDVSITGYFVGPYGYDEEGQRRVAPLLVAAGVNWLPILAEDDVELNPLLWKNVQQNRKGIQPEESKLYYRILDHARKVELDEQRAAARKHLESRKQEMARLIRDGEFPTFVDVFKNPSAYIGKLVTLRGHVRMHNKSPAGENDYGIETLHELWLYTPHSQTNPAVVVCTEVPGNFPKLKGEKDIIQGVTVTGYFFKKYGFQAQDTLRLAPLILAHKVQWTPSPAPSVPNYVTAILGGVCLVAILCMVLFMLRSFRQTTATGRLPDQPFEEPPVDLPGDEPQSTDQESESTE